MFTRGVQIAAAFGLALATGAGWWHWQHTGSGGTDSGSSKTQTIRVRTVRPQYGGVERTVTRPATVHPLKYAKLFTKVSGYLQNQKVDIGSAVKEGDLLAQLYAPELEADVRKSESDLVKAQAQVEVSGARVKASEADLEQAQAKLEQSQAEVMSAQATTRLRQKEYKRISSLADAGSVTRELVDEKEQARKAAEATEIASNKAVATARAAVAASEAKVKESKAELDDARAQVKVAQAVLDRARTLAEYTQIRSPYTGVVTQRGYHDGDFIRDAASSGNATPVLTVARTDVMRVIVWVPDPDVPLTHAGLPATLRVDALHDTELKGKVARTAGAEDPMSRTMRTEVDLDNKDDMLKEGMYGNVTIDLGRTTSGLTIPAVALHGTGKEGERGIYVVRQGKAHLISAKIGQNDGIRAEVRAGLDAHDDVIVDASSGLTDGALVEMVDNDAPGAHAARPR
jgi:RND family efflux transporter MFP subunit